MFEKIQELRNKRMGLVKEARELLDLETTEKRDLTGDEVEKYERIMKDVDRLGEQIEREERLAGIEGVFGDKKTPPVDPGKQEENRDNMATDEYRQAYWTQFRHGKQALAAEEYRALKAGTDAAGGYLVPTEMERKLIDGLKEENVMRQLATVITSSTDRQIPVVASHGKAYWTAEEGNYTESDDAFGQKFLGAHKLTVLMKISEELLQDSAFDLEGYTVREFTRRVGVKEEEAFISGDGEGKPKGFLADAQVGKKAAANNAIAADELIDLYHSLKRPYRTRAVWLVNDDTVKALRKLKIGATDQYLWQPGLQAGEPDRILGRPLVVAAAMPTIDTSAKPIAFGDFSYLWIADRKGFYFQRLNELYATTGHVGFRAYQRVDCVLTLPEAIKLLENAAL